MQNAHAVDRRDDADLLRVCVERGIAFVPFFALAGQRREAGAVTDDENVAAARLRFDEDDLALLG